MVILADFRVKKAIFCSFFKSFLSCSEVELEFFLSLKDHRLSAFSIQNFTPDVLLQGPANALPREKSRRFYSHAEKCHIHAQKCHFQTKKSHLHMTRQSLIFKPKRSDFHIQKSRVHTKVSLAYDISKPQKSWNDIFKPKKSYLLTLKYSQHRGKKIKSLNSQNNTFTTVIWQLLAPIIL